jgi:hypothetical protein
MTEATPIHALVSNVIGGAMLVQHAQARGVDTSCLEDPNSPDTLELYRDLTTTTGLNFEVAATHVLASICALLTNDDVSEHNIKYIARTLWQVLGDPTKNGSEPPPIYTEAGKAVYAWVLVFLYPRYLND